MFVWCFQNKGFSENNLGRHDDIYSYWSYASKVCERDGGHIHTHKQSQMFLPWALFDIWSRKSLIFTEISSSVFRLFPLNNSKHFISQVQQMCRNLSRWLGCRQVNKTKPKNKANAAAIHAAQQEEIQYWNIHTEFDLAAYTAALHCTIPEYKIMCAFQMMLPVFLRLVLNHGDNIISAARIKSHSSTLFALSCSSSGEVRELRSVQKVFTSLTVQPTQSVLNASSAAAVFSWAGWIAN